MRITNILVFGRQWYDNVKGSMLQSSTVYVVDNQGNVRKFSIPSGTGNNRDYIQRASDLLVQKNIMKKSTTCFLRMCEEDEIVLTTELVTVAYKSEL